MQDDSPVDQALKACLDRLKNLDNVKTELSDLLTAGDIDEAKRLIRLVYGQWLAQRLTRDWKLILMILHPKEMFGTDDKRRFFNKYESWRKMLAPEKEGFAEALKFATEVYEGYLEMHLKPFLPFQGNP